MSAELMAGWAAVRVRPVQASEMDSVSHQSGGPQQIPNLLSVDSVDIPIIKRN